MPRRYDAATRGLPGGRARELRDQITAHLDDALPPDADDDEVAATLSRLGAPAEIAAEAGAAVPLAVRRRSRAWALLAAGRPRTWIVAGRAVILVAAGLDTLITTGRSVPVSARGWFTRTEIIPQQAWYLVGPSRGHCG